MALEPHLALPTDLPTVQDVIHAAYSPYIHLIGRTPGPMTDDYLSLINSKHVYIISHQESIQGLLVLIPEKDAMLLDNVAVAPSAQGMGIGRRLIEFAERKAKEGGYGSIRLYTNEKMVENVRLYEKIGYVETHRGEEKGLKRVFMMKSLA
jgi:GNAT superfamily N-acetyltransferase